jgi:light-regulated signal transduction histidine kinase (bacteriophytochrome)
MISIYTQLIGRRYGDRLDSDANDTKLAQLLQNLIGNAIKFRGAEAPSIHVSAEDRIKRGASGSRTTASASIRNTSSAFS